MQDIYDLELENKMQEFTRPFSEFIAVGANESKSPAILTHPFDKFYTKFIKGKSIQELEQLLQEILNLLQAASNIHYFQYKSDLQSAYKATEQYLDCLKRFA